LSTVVRQSTTEKMLHKYFELNPHLVGSADGLREAFPPD
jgi:hypothetical protein